MPLNLSLGRISPLLRALQSQNGIVWPKVVHVAGTNGKGSTTAYISHILTSSKIKTGRFNSPHLVEARDCIQINNEIVSDHVYNTSLEEVNEINARLGINCTEFELLTAVALNCFSKERVDVAVLEVGVGGRLDSTNVFTGDEVCVTAITKVGLDHQGLLGDTLKEIAWQKVGIFKRGVPAVVDGSNDEDVRQVALEYAKEIGVPKVHFSQRKLLGDEYKPSLLGDYQYDNLALAVKVIEVLQSDESTFPFKNLITKESIKDGISKTKWPGRLQMIDFPLSKINCGNGAAPILLDGAHNLQAALELRKYLDSIRTSKGFTFIMGFTKGKDVQPIVQTIVGPQDSISTVQFTTPVEGMPWIESVQAEELASIIPGALSAEQAVTSSPNLSEAISTAVQSGKPIVICGSLYLVADVLRLLKA